MKIAIVGASEQTRHLAPYDKPEYKIWVFNEWANADWCGRWDVLFQLHKPAIYRNPNNRNDKGHWDWLQRSRGKPVYMQEVDPRVPDSVQYPLKEIQAEFGTKYLRMTLAYAIALALYQKAESIDIWGVELVWAAEYVSQQKCFAYWLGIAKGRGVPVTLHCCKGMFDQPLYGYEEYMQEDKIQRYVDGLTTQIEEAKQALARLEGAKMLALQMLQDSAVEEPQKEE